MSAGAAPPEIEPAEGLAGVAVAAGLGLAGGLTLPLAWGLAPALVVGLAAAALIARRGTGAVDPRSLAALPPARRLALAALLLAPMIPFAAVAARAIAGVAVAYPAGLWVAVPGLLAVFAPSMSQRTWLKGLVLCALALGTFAAGAWGARFEAEEPHARGETYSGPILGIHPFQATAVVIDGHGPFDLPINDYVEPDGSKGYGPETLAAALERDLHAIAEQQFAEYGPARAHQAFAAATVVAEHLPEVRERLDRPSERPTEPRLHVTSGGIGRRSRVEFVCPGATIDPRPRAPDPVMERMCPDKYSSEASAGLGLTGRWTGYAELLGQPRLSLGRLLGWPPDRIFSELRVWAWIALGLVLVAACGRQGRAASRLAGWGGAVALVAAVLSFLFIVTGLSVQVEWWARPAAWESPSAVAPWIAMLALGSGHVALAGTWGRGAAGRWRWRRFAPLGPIVAGTLGLCGSLAATTWIVPELAPPILAAGSVPLEGLVAGLGEALHRRAGIGLPAAEGIVAATTVALLLGLLAALLGPVVRAAGCALTPRRPILGAHLGLVVVVVPAALLVLSRMTAGGAALLGPAAAMAWMAGTGLALVAPANIGRRRRAAAGHLLAAAIVVLAGWQALASHANRMMWIAAAIGAVVTLAGLFLLGGPISGVRSASDPDRTRHLP